MVGIMSGENWIGELPEHVRDAIVKRMVAQDLPAGTLLKQAGDPPSAMYQVERGYLRLLGLHRDGQQILILIYKEGNNFSESILVAHRPANHAVVALTDTRLLRLSRADFWDLYQRHPEIPEALCRKFADNISRQFIAREMKHTHKLRKLIALLFENLAEHCGIALPGGGIDITRQSVQREVGVLKGEGILTKQRGIWRIADLGALRQI
jgi:CRP/FNR family cyclic AMP-dependent transcriptional regulator